MKSDAIDANVVNGLSRRAVLYALGAGAALAAGTGLGGAQETPTPTPQGSNGSIHPFFGFSALSPDVEPPVEPDHEVKLLIGPRKNAPPEAPPEFFFEPTGLALQPGETVKFSYATPDHTITSYHHAFGRTQRVPDGASPFSSPVLPGGAYWLYTFEQPGVYDVYCAPHEIFGMVMRLVVGTAGNKAAGAVEPAANETVPEDPEAAHEALPPLLTAALVLEDPALTPENVVENETVSWNDLDPKSKQLLVRFVEPSS